MEIQVSDLNLSATVWDVKRGFAQALHSELFYNPNAHKSRRV